MRLLYFYIARKFWGPFFFALGVFTTLVVLGDMFEKLRNLGNGYTTIGAILTYSLCTFPNWLATIMPVACLLGAISVISEMVSSGEWTACLASGFAPKQLFAPIIACIILVALCAMAVQEWVAPPLNLKAQTIYYTQINKDLSFSQNTEYDVAMKISPLQMLSAKRVDLDKGEMNNVSLETYDLNWNIAQQIVADTLTWEPLIKMWVFKKGTKRIFLDAMGTTEKPFELELAPLDKRPEDMSVARTESSLLSIRALTKRIDFFKHSGLSSYAAETARQARLATPLVTLLMCLLGMPFAISLRRKSKILNIVASMVIAFTFWWVISMITSIGENGYINPFIAGWGPVAFFSIVLFFEFKWLKL